MAEKPSETAALTLAEAPITLANRAPSADQNPVRAYLSSLESAKSRQTMLERLQFLADLLNRGQRTSIDLVPWTQISVVQAKALRAELARQCVTPSKEKSRPIMQPSTMNLTLCALRGVLRAACDIEPPLPELDFERLHRLLRALRTSKAKRLPTGRDLSDAEILRLLRWARTLDDGPYRAMVLGLLAVLLGAGLRREEVCTLPQNALENDVLRVIGKGNFEREIPLTTRAQKDLETWCEVRASLDVTTKTLFVRVTKNNVVHDRPFSVDGLYNLVTSWNDMIWAELPEKSRPTISTHDFRRTFATRRLDDGIDLLVVQRLMGHKSLETTKGYDKRGLNEARRALASSGVY
jgi:integrase/recombinase XerD